MAFQIGCIDLASRLHKYHCTFGVAEDKSVCNILLEILLVATNIKVFPFLENSQLCYVCVLPLKEIDIP